MYAATLLALPMGFLLGFGLVAAYYVMTAATS